METDRSLSFFEKLVIRLITSVIFTGMFVLLEDLERISSLQTLAGFSDKKFLLLFLCLFIWLSVINEIMERLKIYSIDLLFLLLGTTFYVFLIALNTVDIYFITVAALFTAGTAKYVCERYAVQHKVFQMGERQTKWMILFVVSATIAYLGILVILRVVLFKTVTFDFGIFVQMFYYLKECLIPYTTCERYELLSHFTVHFSPFFYLILPFYICFPSPVTLVVVQLLAVVSGVIPLYLLCKNKKVNHVLTFAICFVYLLYPAFRGGLFYDFHENKFLAPLVLWLIFFFELDTEQKRGAYKKWIGAAVFSVLILMVKEDAPIYTACIGLYQFFGSRKRENKLAGILLFFLSVSYFFLVFYFMGIYGDAGSAITSFGRYENLMAGRYAGIGSLVMNMVKDPAYVLSQLMTAEKLEFVLWMFLPVLFLPFRSKNFATYILLIPLVVINLLSDYKYQHSIYYQYAYASGVLVIYSSFLQVQRMRGVTASKTGICLILVTFIMSTACLSEKNSYFREYVQEKEAVAEVRELLNKIPENMSVSATTTYVPVLAQRKEIYRHSEGDETDFVVFSLRGTSADKNMREAETYLDNGYELFGKVEDMVIVLKKIT